MRPEAGGLGGEGGQGELQDGNLLTFPARITVVIGGGGVEGAREAVKRWRGGSAATSACSLLPLLPTSLLARDVAHQDLILWTHWRAPPTGQGTGLPTPLGSQSSLDSHSPPPPALSHPWGLLLHSTPNIKPGRPLQGSKHHSHLCLGIMAQILSSPHYDPTGSLTN